MGTLCSVLPLHWEKPGADFGFLLLDTNNPALEKMGRIKKTGALVAHAGIGYCRRS
jgi:hypothetical protein